MNELQSVRPRGYIEASFAGHNDEGLLVKIDTVQYDIDKYYIAIYDSTRNWISNQEDKKDVISYACLDKLSRDVKSFNLCIVYAKDSCITASYLKKTDLKVPKTCSEQMYDKRLLYGEPVFWDENKGVLPFYQNNKLLAVEVCNSKEATYCNQIMNEVIYEYLSENTDERIVYTKCKRIEGSYIGIVHKDYVHKDNMLEKLIEYYQYNEDKKNSHMIFKLTNDVSNDIEDYLVIWNYKNQKYAAPLCKIKERETARICQFGCNNISKAVELAIEYDKELYGEYVRTECISQLEQREENSDTYLVEKSCLCQDEKLILQYEIATIREFSGFGSWHLEVITCKDGVQHRLFVIADDELIDKEHYDDTDTKKKITFKTKDGIFIINRVYGHNALFKKNLQVTDTFATLDEFLNIEGITTKGNMHAEYEETAEGLKIRLYQNMKNVTEAKLVMYHSQGMGVLAAQDLTVTDGAVEEFVVEKPDIDWDGKFLKPVGSVWFRVAIAIRNDEGIYFATLMNYDMDTDIEKEGNIYDSRKLYLEPIGDSSVCGINMTALPYYAGNKAVSMKYVRPEQLYRSQFTNELLDVRIKKDILTVKMRCRDCGGVYKGVLMEYRKVKEDDTETYLIPYDSLTEDNGSYIMTTRIDMKKYYMRMLYWDIRCAFEIEGRIYTVSCHSNNKKFLRKYKNVFVDRTYPNDNSILFPYATDNDSVALMHRETCPQDHWGFRLKEKIAQKIYKMFKNHWDKKKIYLIFEKYCTMAQDNGYFFFKYCMDANVEADFDGEIHYVIDKKAADWEKVVPYKKHVIKYLSLKHMIYLQACKLMISTDTKGHAYVWRSMGSDIKTLTYKKKLVFLQHGVTAFKRGHFERGTNVGCEYFITTSQFEHDIIHNYLQYPEEEIPITGFARWDVLHDKSEGHREILMMPTWRTWLDDAENEVFAESDYCKNYMALLNDPRLDDILKQHDVTLNFYLHPKFRKFISEFSVVSDNIRLIPFGEEPLNELMMECNLLITDFSSVAWDVYYMNKPVLFYHFDIEVEGQTLGFYMDMKNDIFGDRAEKPDELMELIIEYIENGFKIKEEYSKDREKYFAYVDDNNSERIWKAIQERVW